jgi:hypothetical protein
LKISQFNSSGSGRRIGKSTIVVEVPDSEKYIILVLTFKCNCPLYKNPNFFIDKLEISLHKLPN